jgi:hypothetical protein
MSDGIKHRIVSGLKRRLHLVSQALLGKIHLREVAATVEAFDEALERAWHRRSELSSMGVLAARRIRELTPEDACLEFAERLLAVFS